MNKKIMKYLITFLLCSSSISVQAINFNFDVLPHFHRENLPVKPDEAMLARNCEELDEAITYLIPETYQYKPDFLEDSYNSGAIWASTIDEFGIGEIAWMYLPYSWYLSYREEGRQHKAFYQLEKLRYAKAIKQCYVN